MKKFLLLAVISGLWVSTLNADDWGCKCIICLSNPGGATEFEECKPPIEKLIEHLHKGGDFPDCESAEESGMNVKQGYERVYESCVEGYGSGWENAWSDEGHRRKEYCRKFLRFGYAKRCRGGEGSGDGCRKRRVAIYDEKPLKRREEPFFIELSFSDGAMNSQRFWYNYN